jgi:hypothetical protein
MRNRNVKTAELIGKSRRTENDAGSKSQGWDWCDIDRND